MCPSGETGAGLAPACWPDQKPVRLVGRDRHSRAARGFHPRPTPELVPQPRLEMDWMLADQVDYVVGVDPHRDSHALAIVHVLSGAVVFETTIAA
jgi:hypothetical protein